MAALLKPHPNPLSSAPSIPAFPAAGLSSAALTGQLPGPDYRQRLAASRIGKAEAALRDCRICSRLCGVDRMAGPAGRCGAGPEPRIFSAQVEVGDEWEIIPAFAIALSGCNMRCSFCITGDESWHPSRGRPLEASAVAARAAASMHAGQAQSLLVLGGEPTVHLPWLLRLVAAMPDAARLVLKTNGLSTKPARELLGGLFNTWIIDFKFGGDACAESLSHTPRYLDAIQETLLWAAAEPLTLIVRHLLLPGHIDCCWRPIAAWLAECLPQVKVSLRSSYWPSWRAVSRAPLDRPLAASELAVALEIAQKFNLRLVA